MFVQRKKNSHLHSWKTSTSSSYLKLKCQTVHVVHTHLCGCSEAEEDAEEQVVGACRDKHQVTQSPGQSQYHGQRETGEELFPQRWSPAAARRHKNRRVSENESAFIRRNSDFNKENISFINSQSMFTMKSKIPLRKKFFSSTHVVNFMTKYFEKALQHFDKMFFLKYLNFFIEILTGFKILQPVLETFDLYFRIFKTQFLKSWKFFLTFMCARNFLVFKFFASSFIKNKNGCFCVRNEAGESMRRRAWDNNRGWRMSRLFEAVTCFSALGFCCTWS